MVEKIRQVSSTERVSPAMFAYVQNRIPEISDELYRIDDALKAGFGWENGPFEIWDSIGVEKGIELMKAEGKEPAAWVLEMLGLALSLSIQ